MPSQMSLRVPVDFWLDDKVFNDLLETMKRIGTIREFALFTHYAHTPPTLEQMAEYARIMKQRMSAMRACGFHCGINNLCTLGHADEDMKGAEQLSGRLFTGLDGAASKGNFCPRDPQWLNSYIIPLYKMLAEAEPEFIWLDDDLRLSNHGKARIGCFCNDCLKALSEYFNLPGIDRLGLQDYFETGSPKEIRSKRLKMLDWNRHVLVELEETIAKTIHAVNPNIIIGKMDSPAYAAAAS